MLIHLYFYLNSGPCSKPISSFKSVSHYEEFIRNRCICIQYTAYLLGEAKDTEVNVLDCLIY